MSDVLGEDAIRGFHGEFRFLSNFWYVPVPFENDVYKTVEHAYQAAKTLIPEERMLIKLCESPGQAKKMGTKVTLRSNWEEIKIGIMKQLLIEKFGLYHDLKTKLLATGDREILEENNWGDDYWGTVEGKGKNILGQLLMEVRRELRG